MNGNCKRPVAHFDSGLATFLGHELQQVLCLDGFLCVLTFVGNGGHDMINRMSVLFIPLSEPHPLCPHFVSHFFSRLITRLRREREAQELTRSVAVGAAGVEDGLRRIDDACGGNPAEKKAAVQALQQARRAAIFYSW